MADRDWFIPMSGGSGRTLLAFPHAGAGCAQLAGLARAVAPAVSVWSANLPGRQARLDEPPLTDLDALVAELSLAAAALVSAQPVRRYSLFGYCAGALTALLVARSLREAGLPQAERLIAVSAEAPDIARRPRRLADQPSDRLWSALAETGGVPLAMAADPRIRGVAEAAVRADFTMFSGYRLRPDIPLSSAITVCYGAADPVRRGALLGWRRQTSGRLELRGLAGGHWLLDDAVEEVAALVLETTEAAA